MNFEHTRYEKALKEATIVMDRKYRIILVNNGLDVVPYLHGTFYDEEEFKRMIEFTAPFSPREYTGGYALVCYYFDGSKERYFSMNIVDILEIVRADIPVLKRFSVHAFKEMNMEYDCMTLLDWDIPGRNGEPLENF